jgi:hypothetical protein
VLAAALAALGVGPAAAAARDRAEGPTYGECSRHARFVRCEGLGATQFRVCVVYGERCCFTHQDFKARGFRRCMNKRGF